MKRATICKDPEAGYYRDSFASSQESIRDGKTIAEEFPEQFFQVPIWAAWLLQFTAWIHRLSCCVCGKWDKA